MRTVASNFFKPEFSNSYWLLVEQGTRLFTGVIVGIYVARYLGPSDQGLLAFFVALGAMFSVISKLGLDAVLVRACIPVIDTRKIADSFLLISFSSWLILAAAATLVAYHPQHHLILVALLFLPFQPLGVVDWCLHAEYKAKYGAAFRSCALLLGAVARIIAVDQAAPLWVFIALPAIEQAAALISVFLVAAKGKKYLGTPSGDLKGYLDTIKEGAPLLASGLGVILYMKMDQVMIKVMLGDASLGVYSAATKWYDAWIAVPFLITVSLFPLLLKSQSEDPAMYRRSLVLLFRGVFWISVGVSAIFFFLAEEIIRLSFGRDYIAAAGVLPIVMVTTCWAALGSCTARYLAAEGRYGDVLVRTVVGLLANVAANAILIPQMGLLGAAWATLFCNVIAYYLFDYFGSGSSELIAIKNEAIFGVRRKNV